MLNITTNQTAGLQLEVILECRQMQLQIDLCHTVALVYQLLASVRKPRSLTNRRRIEKVKVSCSVNNLNLINI
jgi:hypothetical protein